MFVHTWLLGVLQSSLVWGLLDVFVNISSANQLLGPVPHGQPRRRVVEEHAIIARPYHTPGENGRKDTRRCEDTKRKTEQMCSSRVQRSCVASGWCAYHGVPGMGLVATGLAFWAAFSSSVISSSLGSFLMKVRITLRLIHSFIFCHFIP